MKIDLHMHSTYSDGEERPATLAQMCAKAGVRLAALTDHDTVSGVEEFLNEAKARGVDAVSGIELSAMRHREVHILGYGIDYKSPAFAAELEKIKQLRRLRNSEILRLLAKFNLYIAEADIAAENGESVGRMHIARAMKEKGYVVSVGEAFDRWLGHGKKAYVPSYRLKPEEAVALISRFNGSPVLAHPLKLNLSEPELKKLVAQLKECGLKGIEAYYVSHTKRESECLAVMAEELGLAVTCGSDYHGSGRIACLGEVESPLSASSLETLF